MSRETFQMLRELLMEKLDMSSPYLTPSAGVLHFIERESAAAAGTVSFCA